MSGTHHLPFVVLSILIAIGASYTALNLAGRVAVARGRARLLWLLGGCFAMGSGIWSMHFVAMLAFHLPVPIAYDVPLVALSFGVAVGASAFALLVASRRSVSRPRLFAAGVTLGIAIITMHYTGMAAVRVGARLTYDPLLVAASILVAISASTVALVLFLWLPSRENRRVGALRAGASVVMGLAIVGMHYIAMAAAHFGLPGTAPAPGGFLLDSSDLTLPVILGSFLILSLALVSAVTDRWVRARLAAQEAAEAASRAKSDFLSRMSHELRTPLNAILGFGQLLDLPEDDAENRECAEQIVKAGRHLLDLINEVLDISGIEAGRLHLSLEPVRVREVITEVLDLVAPISAQQRVVLRSDIPGSADPWVRADRQRLKQVLLNLVANSVKYNQVGGSATVSHLAAPDGRTRILVTDTGPGLSRSGIARLFTPFDRLGAEQTGVEGTGLGLALSRSLMEAMEGSIGVDTEVGHGSTFWVDLPTAASPVASLEVDVAASPIADAVGPAPSRILYVEDNLSNLTLVTSILARRPDIELIPAMQGRLALDLARSHRPDLILLDLHLPDIPGETLLAHFREDPESRNIPVVIVSADATPSQIDRLLAAGALDYITKPIDIQLFLSLLDRVLERKEAA